MHIRGIILAITLLTPSKTRTDTTTLETTPPSFAAIVVRYSHQDAVYPAAVPWDRNPRRGDMKPPTKKIIVLNPR